MDALSKILVVDASPEGQRFLADILTTEGYALVTAGSGPEALARAETERPDLVLLDPTMLGMDGHEVCRKIRGNAATGMPFILMVTPLKADSEHLKGFEGGADEALTRPINEAELLTRVRSLLRIKRLTDTVRAQARQLIERNRDPTEDSHELIPMLRENTTRR